MADFILELSDIQDFGTSNANRYRRQSLIPVCISFKGKESVSALVKYDDFLHTAQRARTSQAFTFKSENKKLDGLKAIVKDIQKDYIKDKVLHVDFQALQKGETVVVRVPMQIVGVAPGVKTQGGIMTPGAREIKLRVPCDNIPEILDVDISSLHIGESVLAGDLELPQGASLLSSPREALASVIESRASKLAANTASTDAAAGDASKAAAAKGGKAKK